MGSGTFAAASKALMGTSLAPVECGSGRPAFGRFYRIDLFCHTKMAGFVDEEAGILKSWKIQASMFNIELVNH